QDIKPDNILIDNRGNYLLTDFGISSRLRSSLRKSTTTGKAMTVAYAPPERFYGTQEAKPAGDIFSFGVLLYELAVGDVPWMGAGGVVVKPDSDPVALPSGYSKRFQSLVQACLRFDAQQRPSAQELQNWAQEFLKEGAWPEIPMIADNGDAEPEIKRGRSTKRMEDIPVEELNPVPQKGKEAATMRQGTGAKAAPVGEKKNNKALFAIIGVVAVVAIIAAVMFLNKDKEETALVTPGDLIQMQKDSLLKVGDSLVALPDYTLALQAYEAALQLDANDSAAAAGVVRCTTAIAELSEDTSTVDSTQLATTTETAPVVKKETTPVVKKETTPVVKKEPVPDEYELRRKRLEKLGDGKKEYDYTGYSSFGTKYNYKGAMSGGKPNGYGIAYYDNGNRYEGNFSSGNRSGDGTLYFEDGTIYKGQWKNDKYNGKGKMTWSDGDYYEGSYSNGLRHGMGIYVIVSSGNIKGCPDCRKYQGYWKENDKSGFGKCYDKYGNLLYEGDFRDDKPTGRYPNQ
ncbi:MAG: protein kinase, partial [Bacteroidota bacterium]|nr:protein kinase [Bacteroidota bacterium]MDX5431374.1 protein kinase [Bacteroidota bacterium]MDX5470104.1 protein kinase [Bacteroidota bacterium]